MNNRLKKMIDDNLIPNKEGVFIDAYNQSVKHDIAGTITTRVDASGHIFITDMKKIPRPTNFENVEQVFRSHTLNEILPHLPNKDCFFDSRHWVYDTTDGVLPFSVTTRIDANNQQFLKEMKDTSIKEKKQSLRIPQATAQGYVEVEPGSLFDGSYPNSKTRRGRVQDNGQSSPTLTANGEPPSYYEGVKDMNYRIRKLTPRECFRLMGVTEADIDKIQQAGISNTRQYQLAGNSIVVDTLVHIFRKMFVDTGQESQQLMLF